MIPTSQEFPILKIIAIVNIALSVVLALWSLVDVNQRPPPMKVMKWVWRLTFLWGGLFALVSTCGTAFPAESAAALGRLKVFWSL